MAASCFLTTPTPPRRFNSLSLLPTTPPPSSSSPTSLVADDHDSAPPPCSVASINNAINRRRNSFDDVTPTLIDEATTEARRVINEEARGLDQLSEMIGESFCRATAVLLSIPGRIIVTGLGKSGHIGRKIASTLASTGSPAFFLHPGDFNHGELGALNRGDGVIMLSRSGDVPELLQTITRCHRLEIPLIAITARSQSKLGQDSNISLLIPDIPEACPHGLAPTTSSTCMLALGDALAMYMMKKRRFSCDQFRTNHPGGNIGRRALTVREILLKTQTKMAPTVFGTTLYNEAVTLMLCGSLGMTGVVDDGAKLADVLTDGAVGTAMVERLAIDSKKITVAEVLVELKRRQPARFAMSADEFTVSEDDQVSSAVTKMNRRQLSGIFVINEAGYSIGFLSLSTCLEAGITSSC